MALPSFASVTDLQSAMQVDDQSAAVAALGFVSTAIRATTGEAWVDDDGALVTMTPLVADLLRTVTIEATRRRILNPDGATQRSEGLGPFTETSTVEEGRLYFTKVEREMLDAAVTAQFPDTAAFPGLSVVSITRGVPIETGRLLGEWPWDDDE